jgi:phosphatidylglycerol:prolipoprotein diacylglycerol transferase
MLFGALPPPDVFARIGPFVIHYYGLLIAVAVCAGFLVSVHVAKKNEKIYGQQIVRHIDGVIVWIGCAGILGGRALFVMYHWNFFSANPLEIIALWHGGWVWHGAFMSGLIALCVYCVLQKTPFFLFAGVLSPGVALGQAIGRWGNYFNQEAYGMPLEAWWALPIDNAHRLPGYEQYHTFHPTFLYESLGDAALFALLVYCIARFFMYARKQKIEKQAVLDFLRGIFFLYLCMYSLMRFGIEFIRIDTVPVFWGLRAPQWISMGMILVSIGIAVLTLQKRAALAKNKCL